MKLDREYQKEILRRLADSYPTYRDCMEWLGQTIREDEEKYAANMLYLEGHGLVESLVEIIQGEPSYALPPEITPKGIDFIANDGGLSAILGVVTIKLHEDTIRDMIATRIISSSMPQSDKQRFVDALKQLPGESIKHLTMRLLDLGLDNWQAALPAIQKYLQDVLC
ncbi:MAG: hypothetical protein NC112_09155 [Oxalobacter formigenes]|nr:hypothetical protein [Oxalobacter formigenes]